MKTTKELARELGLLRKRSSSTSTVLRAQQTCLNAQQFKFLIVIDFESTCWEDEKFKTQEIIEFPAVLLNVVTGEVESVFHHYVQPQEHPRLSDFCTKLTGITQDQVEAGIPINLCLKKFNHWLDRLHREKGVVCPGTASQQPINTTCVTWSDWDLGVCLQYECKRKQLLKPSQLTSWIDLRATYRKFYDRKPNGLNGALQDLGIEFEGREHSGVDDAKNTAKLAYRMIQDGCILKITKTLKTHERSASSSAAITSYFRTQAKGTPPNKKKTKFLSPCTKSKSKSALPNHCNRKDIHAKCGSTPMKGNVSDSPRRKNNSFTPRYQANEISLGNNEGQCSVEQPALAAQWQMSKTSPRATNTNKNQSTSCTSKPCKSPRDASKSSPSKYTRGPGNQSHTASKISPAKHLGKVSCHISSPLSKSSTIQQKSTPKKMIASQTSNKRKQFTPLKDTTVRSPCRKVTRKISPKKLSVQDIYIDPGVSEAFAMEVIPGKVTNKGLKKQDSNIQANTELKNQNINNKSLPKTAKLELPKSKSVQNKENIQKNNYVNRKSFTSSTPLHPLQKSFIQPNQVSPINPKYAGCASTNDSSQFKTPSNSFKTPSHTCFSMTSSSASFKIPNKPLSKSATFDSSVNSSASSGSSMKMTPPLCKCGRRSKRRMVQSPGQNMGRFFFSCPVRPRVGAKEGCDFFKWEQSLEISQRSARSSISSQFTPVIGANTKSFRALPNTQLKRSLGVRPVITNRTYMR